MTTRTALVTGASAGLGAAFARLLAERGDRLVLVARREERLRELATTLERDHGVEVVVEPLDLAVPGSPRQLYDRLQERGIGVDVLINNAGVAGPHLLEDRDWERQAAFYELMIRSVAHLCHLFVPPMVERGYGRVLNVASVAGRITRAAGINYGPSKAWMIAMSQEMDLVVRDRGVYVCALCPGFTHTEFHDVAGLDAMKRGLPAWMFYDAEVVAREGLDALERGRRVYLSGRLYRWVDPLLRTPLAQPFFRWLRRR